MELVISYLLTSWSLLCPEEITYSRETREFKFAGEFSLRNRNGKLPIAQKGQIVSYIIERIKSRRWSITLYTLGQNPKRPYEYQAEVQIVNGKTSTAYSYLSLADAALSAYCGMLASLRTIEPGIWLSGSNLAFEDEVIGIARPNPDIPPDRESIGFFTDESGLRPVEREVFRTPEGHLEYKHYFYSPPLVCHIIKHTNHHSVSHQEYFLGLDRNGDLRYVLKQPLVNQSALSEVNG